MRYTLLLADDSVTIQRVIELTFADEDVQVVAVGNGDEAIERLDSAPPDIVLADIGMPGKNGYEVAQYIKQSPRLAHIPVVLLTGAFEPVDQARAAEAGCDGVLAKPFEPQLVIGRVRELLAKREGRGDASLDTDMAPPPPATADRWAPPDLDRATSDRTAAAATPAAEAPPAEIGDYFDRLDAAFASLSSATAPAPALGPIDAAEPEPPSSPPAQPAVPDEIDWFGAQIDAGAANVPDLPLSYEPPSAFDAPPVPGVVPEEAAPPAPPVVQEEAAPPVPPVVREEAAPLAPATDAAPPEPAHIEPPPVVPPPPELPRKPVALPPLADAFAALLAAEQRDAAPAAAPVWPAATLSSDAIVEQVTRRVLDQLSAQSGRIVRETVTDLVPAIAERLIQDEIERLKAAIK